MGSQTNQSNAAPDKSVPSAEARCLAHATRTGGHFARRRAPGGMGGKGGELRLEMSLTAGRASNAFSISHQLFELGTTVFAEVFVNRHGSYLPVYCIRASPASSRNFEINRVSAPKLLMRMLNANGVPSLVCA